ncbi:Arc family DNA-binding protein [Pseudomonas sp. COR18]|uniref:Arc family DNA-binding protein n=1 Tax=Pseudomonas sp. COR18 TaxID=3399680 RepID=UPI003AFFB9FB
MIPLKERITMTHKKTDSRTADKFVVRLPDGLRDLIAEVAASNGRSMNSEIISRLKGSITGDLDSTELRRLTRILTSRVEELEAQLNLKGAA